MHIKTGCLLAGVALIGLRAQPAKCATITYSQDWSSTNSLIAYDTNTQNYTQAQTLNLQQFDSHLGTLTGVELDYSETFQLLMFIVFNSNPISIQNYFQSAFENILIQPQAPNAADYYNQLALQGRDATFAPNVFQMSGLVPMPPATVTVSGADFAAYAGAGTFGVDITDQYQVNGYPTGYVRDTFASWAFGNVSVTYAYNPIPEPWSVAVLLIGFIGLVFAANHRRARQSPNVIE